MEFERKCFLSIFFMLGFLLVLGVTTHADRGVDLVGVEAKQSGLQDLSLISSAPSPLEASEPQRSAASAARSSVDRPVQCDLGEKLYDAAWKGKIEVVEKLLAAGADPDYKTEDGRTPLYESARYGHASVVKLLLAKGANRGLSITDGWRALHAAAEYDRQGHIVSMLASKDTVNITSISKDTPLHRAALFDNAAAASWLLNKGASKVAKNAKGLIPFNYAMSEALEFLLNPKYE